LTRQVMRHVLIVLQPPGADPVDYAARVDAFAAALAAHLLANPLGMRIRNFDTIEERRLAAGDVADAPNFTVVRLEDVQSWVEAGLAGDPLGKNLTPLEGDAGDRQKWQTIHNVWDAIEQLRMGVVTGKTAAAYERLEQRLVDYIEITGGASFGEFLQQAGQVWLDAFGPVFLRDFGLYVDGKLRKL